jgi:hypothetical protein
MLRRPILRNFQSAGDIVMLTAAVRNLHRSYPGEFVPDVRTPFPELWRTIPTSRYVAGTGLSPVPLIEKHHERIFSMHLKDRKRAGHDKSENMPWGQATHRSRTFCRD